MKCYDVAIIGLGTMGSFAAWELARRKFSVVGFDQFAPPHHRGSHSGETRIFRIAYSEHPNYVPLAQRSEALWERFSEELATTLLFRSGLLSMGREGSELISGIRKSASTHNLTIETLSAIEIRKQFPAFLPPDDYVGLLEETAGWIDVDASIQFSLKQAQALGSDLFLDTSVVGWKKDGGRLEIQTDKERFQAQKLVITAGAWAHQLLRELGLPLTVRRKVLVWFEPLRPEHFNPDAIPLFAFAPNFFYGFPNIGGRGVKIAEHLGGLIVEDVNTPVAAPTAEDLEPLLLAASKFLPSLVGPWPGQGARLLRAMTCLYTMTPDEHFIIDQHPQIGEVLFAAGFSGHGFKFAPLIAEALADLALEGKTSVPIDFLRLKRRLGD